MGPVGPFSRTERRTRDDFEKLRSAAAWTAWLCFPRLDEFLGEPLDFSSTRLELSEKAHGKHACDELIGVSVGMSKSARRESCSDRSIPA